MTRMLFAAALAALPLSAAAQDAPPPEANRLFMLKIAQSVDDRCRIMPPDVRREFDGRVAKLAAAVEPKVGRAVIDEMTRTAPERAAAHGNSCDERTKRFLEGSYAQSSAPP